MRRRFVAPVILTMMSAIVLAGTVRSQPDAAGPRRVTMTLRALATPANGPSFEHASADVVLAVGETGATSFSAATDLCAIAAGATARMLAPHHAWTVRFTLVGVEIDKVTVDVVTDRRDESSPVVKLDSRHLVLTEGAPHILDFVDNGGSASCGTRSIALEVSAALEEAPAFAGDMLSYDLWLTHRDAAGREWTRHEGRSARQGELTDFRFQPLRWTLDALIPAGDRDMTIDELVSGSIRGRIRDDGRIDVSFQTFRALALNQGSTGELGGRKIFVVQPAEPIRIELPPASGQIGPSRRTGTSAYVDLSEAFGGHTTAVVVKIDRLP
jgi:hypothetical protein